MSTNTNKKINSQRDYWNQIYSSLEDKRIKYDSWLDKYEHILINSKDTPIIDLGCGFGNDTFYLIEKGYEVVACDYSEKALERLNGIFRDLTVKCFDFKDGLPFANDSAKIIISDLSLHYFSWQDTEKILKDIDRVLKSSGILLCRVNSIKDINHGAGQGLKIEENFFDIDGNLKRFFNEKQLKKLFKDWRITHIEEYEMDRYKNNKVLWEVAVVKK